MAADTGIDGIPGPLKSQVDDGPGLGPRGGGRSGPSPGLLTEPIGAGSARGHTECTCSQYQHRPQSHPLFIPCSRAVVKTDVTTIWQRPAMGYRGKLAEREKARRLRGEGRTLEEIASELAVSKSSASIWVRDVAVPGPARRTGARRRGPNVLQLRKAAEIEEGREWGRTMIGQLSDRDLLIAGTALYAGEGSKTDGSVRFANSDPRMVRVFMAWLRRFFDPDEGRLRANVYLHQGLDLDAAEAFWSELMGIPRNQFTLAYRAVPDQGRRSNKHRYGCAYVCYRSSSAHRRVMGLVGALLTSGPSSGVAQ